MLHSVSGCRIAAAAETELISPHQHSEPYSMPPALYPNFEHIVKQLVAVLLLSRTVKYSSTRASAASLIAISTLVNQVKLASQVLQASRVIPISRQSSFLRGGRLVNLDRRIRVHGETVPGATLFVRISAAIHIAISFHRCGPAIADKVVTETLHCKVSLSSTRETDDHDFTSIFHSSNGVSHIAACCYTCLDCHGGIVWLLLGKYATILSVNPATLINPSCWKASHR